MEYNVDPNQLPADLNLHHFQKWVKNFEKSYNVHLLGQILASSRQNLSSGFPTKRDSNQSPQLQRLARKVEFCVEQA